MEALAGAGSWTPGKAPPTASHRDRAGIDPAIAAGLAARDGAALDGIAAPFGARARMTRGALDRRPRV